MEKKNINDGMVWALTPEALDKLRDLTRNGMDLDLAMAMLEQIWTEDEIYSIEDEVEVYEAPSFE